MMTDQPADNASKNATEKSAERIAKYLAHAGVCSRRDAEKLIGEGRVMVDGETLTTPAFKVFGHEDIRVDEVKIGGKQATRLWRFHKPDNLVTTHKDPQERMTVFDALPDTMPRVVSVGRLDLTTEGLLLLTTDGGLARQLELPATGWTRRYKVRVYGRVNPTKLARVKDGCIVEGVEYGPIAATLDSQQGDNSWITVAIKEGKNREIRNVMRHLDLHVNRLIRTAYGPFQLGALKKGFFEEVPTKQLKEQLGKKMCAELGL